MNKNIAKKIIGTLLILATIGSFGTVVFAQSAQQILHTVVSALVPPTNLPFLNSPYVLNTAGIVKNTANNTWNIDYSIPPNTYSGRFFLQINGQSVGNGQILAGMLVFRVPDASFGPLGTAMIALVDKTTMAPVAMNAVLVLAQGLQPSPYILNPQSIIQNPDRTWSVGYFVPPNTQSTHFSLTVGSKGKLTNGRYAYGGMIFKVPESYFVSGDSLTLTLTDETSGVVLATNIVNVPYSGPSPYVIDQGSIVQNPDGSWSVGYQVPPSTAGSHFSITPGTGKAVTNGAFVKTELVFNVPQDELTPKAQVEIKLKDETTGQVRATDTVSVPDGLGILFSLDASGIVQNTDGSWSIPYKVPANTHGSDYDLVIGTKGQFNNGNMVNNELVFKVPSAAYTAADQNTLALKNGLTGKTYNADGTVTQGTADIPVDLSKESSGLIISFPPDKQNIKQTTASIVAKIHPTIDLPKVSMSYIWNKSSDPASNITKPLLSVPGPAGLKAAKTTVCSQADRTAGTCTTSTTTPADDREATLSFTGLSAGVTYQFVIKNNLTGTVSDPIQFTTPTTANGKSYISYAGGLTDYTAGGGFSAPSTAPAIVDDISDKGIVPRCGLTPGSNDDPNDPKFAPCGYNDFLKLISNIIKYGLIIIGPLIAILAIYYGFVIMILGRIPDPTGEQRARLQAAKAGLVKIAIGIVIILSGWTIIATITRELGVKSSYTFLDLFSGN